MNCFLLLRRRSFCRIFSLLLMILGGGRIKRTVRINNACVSAFHFHHRRRRHQYSSPTSLLSRNTGQSTPNADSNISKRDRRDFGRVSSSYSPALSSIGAMTTTIEAVATTTSTNSSSSHGSNQNSVDDNLEGGGGGFTICHKCKGEGKLIQPPSRKARRRHKLNNNNNNNSSSSSSTSQANQKQASPPPRIDGCKVCQGSGLLVVTDASVNEKKQAKEAGGGRRPATTTMPRVAIIGGGLGGLALAVACRHRSIPFRVYERDTNFHQRSQGYGLTMQQASRALESLGISTPLQDGIISTKHIVHTPEGRVVGEWGLRKWLSPQEQQQRRQQRHAQTNSTSHASNHEERNSRNQIATNKNKSNNKNKRQNVHIARQSLRMALLKALGGENEVEWGHKLVNFTQHEDRVDLVFDVVSNSSSQQQQHQQKTKEQGEGPTTAAATRTTPQRQQKHATATLLVGADGIRSSVRKQWLGQETTPLRYLGCIVILGICPLQSLSALSTASGQSVIDSPLLDGETVFQTADGSTRIYMMPYSNTEYMWQLSFPMLEQDAKELSRLGPLALKDESLKRCNSWHDPIIPILQQTPVGLVSGYPVYDRDLLTKEIILESGCLGTTTSAPSTSSSPGSRGRVTLLGDACHPMSPFKGQGANQALLDGLSLARILYKQFQRQPQQQQQGVDDDGDEMKTQRQATVLNSVLETYEDEMLSRSAVKVKASAEAAHFLHTEIAIQEGNVTRGTAAAISANATNSSSPV